MGTRLHQFVIFSLFACAGCASTLVATIPEDPQDVPARRALYAANPEGLDEAFAAGCNAPGDTFSKPDRRTAQCDIVPTPESAAFLLTLFDAKLEAPKLIVQKLTDTTQDGVLVELSYYAIITAKSGRPQRVYFQNRTLDRRLDALLRGFGGEPA